MALTCLTTARSTRSCRADPASAGAAGRAQPSVSPATASVARRLDMVHSSLRLFGGRGEGGVWATRAERGTLAQEVDDLAASSGVVHPGPVACVRQDPDRCTPQRFGIPRRVLRR